MSMRRQAVLACVGVAVVTCVASCASRVASRAVDDAPVTSDATSTASPLPPAATSVSLSGTIPWIDTAVPPFQTPTPSPAPLPAIDARPCRADDVAANFGAGDGAGGHLITYVQFRNVSQTTCVLKGYPDVTASEAGLPDVAATKGSFFQGSDDVTANMRPGQQTLLGLETDTYCGARPGGGGGSPAYHHVTISLPGGGTITLDRQPEGFDVTCGLHLTRFSVPQPEPPQPPDPLTELTVSIETPTIVDAGDTLIYVADLGNPTAKPISLTLCPGYIESARSPTAVKDLYALNCVPAAAIAAHDTVRFEMRMQIPADTPAGTLTIFWNLIGPSRPGASAALTVTLPPTPSPLLNARRGRPVMPLSRACRWACPW